MKFLIVDTYYPTFLRYFYAQHPELAQRPYAEQWRALMDQCFGTADFYSSNLQKLGHEATEVVANCEPLQRRWAKEHEIKLDEAKWIVRMRKGFVPWPQRVAADWFYPILIAQVKHYRPDVLYIQDMNGTSPVFLRKIRPYVRLITGQIACPIALNADFSEYDLILSSFPHFVERFRKDGLSSAYLRIGFEPKVLGRLQAEEKRYPVVFVGGLSPSHSERIRFLETVCESQPVDLWGYGVESLPQDSPLRARHCGEAWGLDMYNVLYNAEIALNHHINVAANYANNMRLYEATGVGTLLITDYKDNLHTLFEPGKEVVAYRSTEECVELITYYLEHEEERKAIAQAGQQRTLREHTYYHRMQELVDIVTPLLRERGRRRRDVGVGWRAAPSAEA
jgi:hypothetical protein